MTLVAGLRFDNVSIVLSDIRVSTPPDRRTDAFVKFVPFPPDLGLFVAGDVGLWQRAHPSVLDVATAVTPANLVDPEGPLRIALNRTAMEGRDAGHSGAVGLLLDQGKHTHTLFNMELVPGCGCRMNTLGRFESVAIGSGAVRPVREVLARIIREAQGKDPSDPLHAARAIREGIQFALGGPGSSSFRALGVSPFITLSIIEGSYFRMVGEESRGGYVDRGKVVQYHYEFVRDERGDMMLSDLVSGEARRLVDPIFGELADLSTFDPQRIE